MDNKIENYNIGKCTKAFLIKKNVSGNLIALF